MLSLVTDLSKMDISAASPFSRAFDYASDRTGRRFQNPLYFITELVTGSKFRSSLAEVKRFGQEIVSNARARRREQKQAKPTSDPAIGSLIDSLMDAFDDDPSLTADAALNFLSAGRDTTAQSLTWTFYSLMRHPPAIATLRKEIDSTISSASSDPSSQGRPLIPLLQLSVADLQPNNLPHTISIFNESLRLYPPVPFEIKQCQVDTTLPDHTFLPKGSIIIWCIWAMNRSQEIWGYDSDIFRPERWLTSSPTGLDVGSEERAPVKLVTKSAFEFPVFNGGPRSCLGKKMAELMACWVLVQMWREFEFEEIFDEGEEGKGTQERRSQNSLTLPMEGGLPCRVRLREVGR
jgi:cytochrome P450